MLGIAPSRRSSCPAGEPSDFNDYLRIKNQLRVFSLLVAVELILPSRHVLVEDGPLLLITHMSPTHATQRGCTIPDGSRTFGPRRLKAKIDTYQRHFLVLDELCERCVFTFSANRQTFTPLCRVVLGRAGRVGGRARGSRS
jgi:hypothetical protein